MAGAYSGFELGFKSLYIRLLCFDDGHVLGHPDIHTYIHVVIPDVTFLQQMNDTRKVCVRSFIKVCCIYKICFFFGKSNIYKYQKRGYHTYFAIWFKQVAYIEFLLNLKMNHYTIFSLFCLHKLKWRYKIGQPRLLLEFFLFRIIRISLNIFGN